MKSTVPANLDFSQLVKTHHDMVWRYLRLLGCESALAEDLTQETFLAIFRKPFAEINERATGSYLRCVARNIFVDAMRRQNRIIVGDLDQADLVWERTAGDDDGDTWRSALRECLESIDGRPRHVLALRFQDKLPIRTVAEIVGMKESGVKTLLGRIKNRLRECVERKVSIS